ncbi:hypothetical protein VKT23_008705 [Stygiomarasmius scandens]|uniref:Uncharacterized protein n=1 Tax=Marasmiellus scandens TaxID=2682957 RepID=A0ABR1JMJ1_9AGAR
MVDWLKIGETVAAIARVAEGVASIARGTRVAVEELIRTIDIVLGKSGAATPSSALILIRYRTTDAV